MKIVVCVKYCPDAQGERTFNDADHTTERDDEGVLSELDEYAVEAALQIADERDAEVIALTVGPEDADQAVRKALQMGATAGVHVCDDAIAGSDALATSQIIATAVQKIGDVDLLLTGMASTDGEMGVVPAMVAERLSLPAVTYVSELTVTDSDVVAKREGDAFSETIAATLPALVSVTDQFGEARYPTFKGIMAAKKKPLDEWELEDLDIDEDGVGLDASWARVSNVTERPPRTQGEVITDEGNGGEKLAEFLAAKKFI